MRICYNLFPYFPTFPPLASFGPRPLAGILALMHDARVHELCQLGNSALGVTLANSSATLQQPIPVIVGVDMLDIVDMA